MSRMRTLKPGFFLNEVLAEIDPLGRLLFQGLWCLADREGRLEDRPRKIKAEVLPYDDVDMDALLDELQAREFILRYEVDGSRYISVLTFKKHQSPHIKEAASTIPAPCKPGESTMLAPPVTLTVTLTDTGTGTLSPSGEGSLHDDIADARESQTMQKTAATTSTAWNERILQQTADHTRNILHLPPRDLANLKITLAQFSCAPPYLEGEAASCADWCAQHQKRATVAGFNRWLHRSERERLNPEPAAREGSSNRHEQSTSQQQQEPKPLRPSDADLRYEFLRQNGPPKLVG